MNVGNLTVYEDIRNDLKVFEAHWIEISEELKKSELSSVDAQSWRRRFGIQKREFLWSHTIPNDSSHEINHSVDNIEHLLEIGILAGRKNYRDNEGIRLKNKFGFLGELYYWFKEFLKR